MGRPPRSEPAGLREALDQEIERLTSQINRLEGERTALRRLQRQQSAPAQAPRAPKVDGEAADGLPSLSNAILEVISAAGKGGLTGGDVIAALHRKYRGKFLAGSIRSTMSRLKAQGLLTRSGRSWTA
jgi:hypothetical protein